MAWCQLWRMCCRLTPLTLVFAASSLMCSTATAFRWRQTPLQPRRHAWSWLQPCQCRQLWRPKSGL